jgi:hypothetical protein
MEMASLGVASVAALFEALVDFVSTVSISPLFCCLFGLFFGDTEALGEFECFVSRVALLSPVS